MRLVACSDGLEYTTAFHALLYSLKAFLDVYAFLACMLINPNTSPTSFGKRRVGGETLAGAKLAKWIENCSPASFRGKTAFRDLVISNSRNWISEAVCYRDTLAHRREIEGMSPMLVSLTPSDPPFKTEGIALPILPNGKRLDEYSIHLLAQLGNFIDQTLFLLPGINTKLPERWPKVARTLEQMLI